MSPAEKSLHDAVIALVEEDVALALSVLTGHFVGLAVAMISARGYPDDRDIFLDGGTSRDITIHQKGGAV
jgi:hypothetical protein